VFRLEETTAGEELSLQGEVAVVPRLDLARFWRTSGSGPDNRH
jgi:hypothetical protein